MDVEAERVTIPPCEDREAILKVSGLLLTRNAGATDDQPFVRYTASDGFERLEKRAERLSRCSSEQGRSA
jgi:hypothetical protein